MTAAHQTCNELYSTDSKRLKNVQPIRDVAQCITSRAHGGGPHHGRKTNNHQQLAAELLTAYKAGMPSHNTHYGPGGHLVLTHDGTMKLPHRVDWPVGMDMDTGIITRAAGEGSFSERVLLPPTGCKLVQRNPPQTVPGQLVFELPPPPFDHLRRGYAKAFNVESWLPVRTKEMKDFTLSQYRMNEKLQSATILTNMMAQFPDNPLVWLLESQIKSDISKYTKIRKELGAVKFATWAWPAEGAEVEEKEEEEEEEAEAEGEG